MAVFDTTEEAVRVSDGVPEVMTELGEAGAKNVTAAVPRAVPVLLMVRMTKTLLKSQPVCGVAVKLGTVDITIREMVEQISKGKDIEFFFEQISPLRTYASQVFYRRIK